MNSETLSTNMKLSIITVNLNNKNGLQKTIDSVISQIFKDFEWIVIDGGSTDGSKELIEKYSNYISYWVSEPDKGVYNAMNKGICIAKGEYINFLNSGDYYVNSTTLHNVFIGNYKEDIVFGNSLDLTEPITRNKNFSRSKLFVSDFMNANINHQAMFIKRSLFQKYGYYDESLKLYSDWKFNILTIGLNRCSTKYISEDVVYYDINGISSTNKELSDYEINKMFSDLLPKGVIEDYKYSMSISEIRRYRFSKMLYSLLYRSVVLYEKIRKLK